MAEKAPDNAAKKPAAPAAAAAAPAKPAAPATKSGPAPTAADKSAKAAQPVAPGAAKDNAAAPPVEAKGRFAVLCRFRGLVTRLLAARVRFAPLVQAVKNHVWIAGGAASALIVFLIAGIVLLPRSDPPSDDSDSSEATSDGAISDLTGPSPATVDSENTTETSASAPPAGKTLTGQEFLVLAESAKREGRFDDEIRILGDGLDRCQPEDSLTRATYFERLASAQERAGLFAAATLYRENSRRLFESARGDAFALDLADRARDELDFAKERAILHRLLLNSSKHGEKAFELAAQARRRLASSLEAEWRHNAGATVNSELPEPIVEFEGLR